MSDVNLKDKTGATSIGTNDIIGFQAKVSGSYLWRQISRNNFIAWISQMLSGSFVPQSGTAQPGTIWNGDPVGITYGGTGGDTAATARAGLGLSVGADVQAYSALLDAVAAATQLSLTNAVLGFTSGLGAGGSVTQATNRSTAVTLSKRTGLITTHTASLAAGSSISFTVNNTTVIAGDVILLNVRSGSVAETSARISGVTANAFTITLRNHHASTAETGALLIDFIILRASSN